MDKVIIFGSGSFGIRIYESIKFEYDVQYFCDNDNNKWDSEVFGIKVISPNKLKMLEYDKKIIVASTYYYEIIEQLVNMGISNIWYVAPNNNFIEKFEDSDLYFGNYSYVNKIKEYNLLNNQVEKILFVQDSQCIRTYKIAKILKEIGIQVDIAYLNRHPTLGYKELNLPYTNIIKINDSLQFIQFINESDYDVVHSSNEPDFLTTLLIRTNKAVIHDCHDLMSLRGDISDSDIINEYVAHKYCDGNIYVDYPVRNYAINKFAIKNKPVLVLNNYTLKEQKPEVYLNKLSEKDGELHCVYEGGLSNNPSIHRYLENKFLKLANSKIHVHFYTINEDKYYKELESKSEYIHWEGICPPYKLIEEMTKFDVGLVILNVNMRNKKFLSSTFPNKIFEYLNSGIPVAVEKLPILEKFTKETECGKSIDFNTDLYKQIKDIIINIKVDRNFLEKNKFTMEDQVEKILYFYNEVIKEKYNK